MAAAAVVPGFWMPFLGVAAKRRLCLHCRHRGSLCVALIEMAHGVKTTAAAKGPKGSTPASCAVFSEANPVS